MNLCELAGGTRGKVLSVELPSQSKERLRAMGIYADEKVFMLKVIRRKIFIVRVESSGVRLALDKKTAAGVCVWKI